MSLSGARGLARISQNPRCDLQTAMVVGQVDEIDFFEALTGQQFEGEYGERTSARRRGDKFEKGLHQNNAAELRRILAPRFGYDPERMYVRNLADEIPDHMMEAHRRRYARTARIFADVAGGCEPPSVPHLLIEPQLRLPVGGSRFVHVAPDFAVFDSATECYVVGEEKSMIIRSGSPDRVDLERTRRQAGAEALALRLLAERLNLSGRVRDRAIFVFSSPFGVRPHPPVEEYLHAEVSEIRRALERYRTVSEELQVHGKGDGKKIVARAHQLGIHFQNSCLSSCALFYHCKDRVSETVLVLGDEAKDAFGGTTELEHLYALADGTVEAKSAEEEALAARLRETASLLGVGEICSSKG
jgi:hypothetical protein